MANIVDFANQVKSYALGIKDQQMLGAWNLLKNDGLATSTTEGATFTKNADLSVTINRETATTNASYYNVTSGTNGEVTETRESGTYYLSGVPNGSTGLTLQYYDVTANQSWNDSGSGAEITVVKGHTIKVSMRVAPNQTLSNVTVKPMISLEPNQPYVSYAMTNKELTDRVIPIATDVKTDFNTWLANIDNQVSAQQATLYRLGKLVVFMTRLNVPLNHAFNASNVSMPSFLPVPMLSTYGFFQAAGIEANSMLTTGGKIYLIIPSKSSGNAFADVLYVYFTS